MFSSLTQKREIRAAKFSFFLAGFSIAAWAPLVPYVQDKLNVTHFELSRIILLMGVGSVVGILIASFMVSLFGVKKTLITSAAVSIITTIYLAFIPGFFLTAFLIFVYGLTLGCLEVASNIYATLLEKKYKEQLLSTLHGFYSSGEIVSLLLISALLFINFGISLSITLPIVVLSIVLFVVCRHIVNEKGYKGEKNQFAVPRGIVLSLSLIASFILMIEGSMLDWSALLMMQKTDIDIEQASYGYMVVVTFLAIGRFMGASLIKRYGSYKVICVGLLCSSLALFIIFSTKYASVLFMSFALLGFSMANILPLAVSLAGRQNKMSAVAAVSAVSTCGYGALVLGPACIGFISELSSLNIAFLILAIVCLVVLGAALTSLHEYRKEV